MNFSPPQFSFPHVSDETQPIPTTGFNNTLHRTTVMGCEIPDRLAERLSETMNAVRERLAGRDVTATVDERGRLTIKEDDRKALGINGNRAVLDLHVQVLESDADQQNPDQGDGT